eukprot:1391286-Rhodomonas_salina.2
MSAPESAYARCRINACRRMSVPDRILNWYRIVRYQSAGRMSRYLPRVDSHVVGDHERRVEPDTEPADDVACDIALGVPCAM